MKIAFETKEIRSLKKKLMQIEHLKNLKRALCEDERIKLTKAESYRARLTVLIQSAQSDSMAEGGLKGDFSPGKSSDASSDLNMSWNLNPSPVRECGDGGNPVEPTPAPSAPMGDPIQQLYPDRNELEENVTNDVISYLRDHEPSVSGCQTPQPKRRVDLRKRRAFGVKVFHGHTDLVSSADFDDEILISVGRDTTARVWDIKTGKEINSLRGHTNAVTAVVLLSPTAASQLCQLVGVRDQKLCLTASLDCHVKLWLLEDDYTAIRSIYTFSGITCLQSWCSLDSPDPLAVIGNEGGKIEIYDMVSRQPVLSCCAFDDQVSSLQVDNEANKLYASSWDGKFLVWDLIHVTSPGSGPRVKVNWLYKSDLLCNPQRKIISASMVKCLSHCKRSRSGGEEQDILLYVDRGVNLKALEWAKGQVTQYKNQRNEYSISDSVVCAEDYVLTSTFDLESEHGCVHVRDLVSMDYITSLCDGETQRILGMQAKSFHDSERSGTTFRFVTFGHELKVWDWFNPRDRRALKLISKWSDAIIYPEPLDSMTAANEIIEEETGSGSDFLSSSEDEEGDELIRNVDDDSSESEDEQLGPKSPNWPGSFKEEEESSGMFKQCAVV